MKERLVELLVKKSTRDMIKIVKGTMTYEDFILHLLDNNSVRYDLMKEMIKQNFNDKKIIRFFSKLPAFDEKMCKIHINCIRNNISIPLKTKSITSSKHSLRLTQPSGVKPASISNPVISVNVAHHIYKRLDEIDKKLDEYRKIFGDENLEDEDGSS